MNKRTDVPQAPVDSPIIKLMRLARHFVPASLRARLRADLLRWLDLSWYVTSELRVRVYDRREWVIYNEVFVRGEYDEALAIALEPALDDGSPIHIVDLGANVGYFTLRAVQALIERKIYDRGFGITAVEANARCAREFRQMIFYENRLSDRVRLAQGLVGERAGKAMFYENSLFRSADYSGVEIDYVDLSSVVASVPRIDLLKCDIEGAELLLVQNYPDVFQKIRVAIFELHPALCDVERCRDLLRAYGFTHEKSLPHTDLTSIYTVWR